MSLPQEPVFSLLKSDFNVGWKNIKREDYVGKSHGYQCNQTAVGTTNGAGPKNTQIFVLSPGGVVLHALPGFWHPEDLAHELSFAKVMHRLWKDKKRGVGSKRKMFKRMQLAAIKRHSPAMVARSGWQGFDAQNEMQRLAYGDRDTFVHDAQGNIVRRGNKPVLKTINRLVHERMAERPFLPFTRFDVDKFADYGRAYYDNNKGVDGTGVQFGTEGYMESQKRQKAKRMKRAAERAKAEPNEKPDEKKGYDKSRWQKKGYEKKPGPKTGRRQKATSRPTSRRSSKRPTSRPTSRPSRRR